MFFAKSLSFEVTNRILQHLCEALVTIRLAARLTKGGGTVQGYRYNFKGPCKLVLYSLYLGTKL